MGPEPVFSRLNAVCMPEVVMVGARWVATRDFARIDWGTELKRDTSWLVYLGTMFTPRTAIAPHRTAPFRSRRAASHHRAAPQTALAGFKTMCCTMHHTITMRAYFFTPHLDGQETAFVVGGGRLGEAWVMRWSSAIAIPHWDVGGESAGRADG